MAGRSATKTFHKQFSSRSSAYRNASSIWKFHATKLCQIVPWARQALARLVIARWPEPFGSFENLLRSPRVIHRACWLPFKSRFYSRCARLSASRSASKGQQPPEVQLAKLKLSHDSPLNPISQVKHWINGSKLYEDAAQQQ